MTIWPSDEPPSHVSWKDRVRPWKWPRTLPPSPTPHIPPPDYDTAPINITRMYVGACARNLETDRIYQEVTTPPTTPPTPNLVWPAVDKA